MIGFVIWSIAAFLFAGIGISCMRSKEAVGFFTFVKPPVIAAEKVKKYNRAVSRLWFVSAGVFEMTGVPFLFAEQNSPVFIFIELAVMLLVIAMMIAFVRIEAKYRV